LQFPAAARAESGQNPAMSTESLQTLKDVAGWGAVVGVFLFIAFLQVRLFCRGARMKRFARKHGYRFFEKCPPIPKHWADIACLHVGTTSRALHCIEGERHGRLFTAFDYHYDLPSYGSEARANMTMLLTGWVFWYLLPWIDVARDPVFSAAVVTFPTPPGARTTSAEKALTPWRVEFGENASIIRSEDGMRPPAEVIAAVDRLNDALDEIARGTSARPAPAA
jgi:hypothetical protein